MRLEWDSPRRKLAVSMMLSLAIQIWAVTKLGVAGTPFDVGYQVLDVKYKESGKEQVITVAVWYPTREKPQS